MDSFEMFKLMLDDHTARIVDLTSERAMNAVEISDTIGIPIAACYRRIRALRSAGLIREDSKVMSEGGKSVVTYRSTIQAAEVILQDGHLRVLMNVGGEETRDEVNLEEPSMLHWALPQENDGPVRRREPTADRDGCDDAEPGP